MFWGAGIEYEASWRDDLLAAAPEDAPEFLEIAPAHFFGQPGRLDDLAERWPIVMRGEGGSLGTAMSPSRPWISAVNELVHRARPLVFTEYLAMTHSADGIDLGHRAPLWYTLAQLEIVIANVKLLKRALGIPVALENIAAPFIFAPADFEEPEFMTRVVNETGCGIHLDLTGLVVTSRALGVEPEDLLARYPLDKIWLVHLAGSGEDLERAVAMLDGLRGRAHVRGIVIDTEPDAVGLEARVTRARQARRVWTHGAN